MKFQSRNITKSIISVAILAATLTIVSVSVACNCEPEPTPIPTETATPIPEPTEVTSTPVPTEAVVAPAVNMDENVSFNDSDLGVALYKSEDADGNAKMDLYNVETGTNITTYMVSITQDDIAPFMSEHPAVNTLLASGGGVSIYVLTTGEIQINAGPDKEGKIHVKIFDGIPWTHVYGYTIDPV